MAGLKWLQASFRIFPLITTSVDLVERMWSERDGKAKEVAAIDLISTLVPLVEASVGRDLLNEALVIDALKNVIAAVVSFNNVIRDVQTRRAGRIAVVEPSSRTMASGDHAPMSGGGTQ